MRYCENWEAIAKRYEEFWARENHDRPILSIRAPKAVPVCAAPKKQHATLRERWWDTQYQIEVENAYMQNTFYGCEAFPAYSPNLGPDFFAACFGCELEYGESTSWAISNMTDADVEAGKKLVMDRGNKYYQKMLEMTAAAVEDGRDKYLVGVTDIHPGADGLVSLRGPQQLCMDTVDHPELLSRGTMEMFEGFRTMYDELYTMTTKYQKGATNWMGIWHPGRWYVTSCDFSCMISPGMYEDFILEELQAELEFLDASVYHLDGPGALKHLDLLLEQPKLKGVQWVYGDGQPTASHWLGTLKKIQDAGKCIQVNVAPGELETMLQSLKPEGVMYNLYCSNEDEARQAVALAEKYQKKLH
ncbi:MAG: trimethylamine corrinoid protein 2 [Eubacteriales bacterium]|nr:trimethylamine corrinoid protein 2 [Eubacteriales bacterium]